MFDPRISETITLAQAAAYAGISRRALQDALMRGDLRGIKLGGVIWITTRDAVDAYYKGRQSDWLNKRRREERGAKIRAGWTCARCGAKEEGRHLKQMTIYSLSSFPLQFL